MAYFQTKNLNLGKFLRVLKWKMLVYFIAIWDILRPFCIFCGHLGYLMVIWYIFPVLVCCTKKNLATLVGVQLGEEANQSESLFRSFFLHYFSYTDEEKVEGACN
jgi:hypothetical protein